MNISVPILVATSMMIASASATKAMNDKPTVLITGANRGIGLEFVRQLADRDWRIIATARSPDDAVELRGLATENPDILIEQLDVTDHKQVDARAERYKTQAIDILLLNAALGPTPKTAMSQLATLDWEVGRQSIEVNAIGPMKVSQAFMEHVQASQKKQIIAMSSDSGSFVAGSQAPILYHYKMSKAALNMYLHTLAFETRKHGVTIVMLHPGIVATNPGLSKMPGALKTADSVAQMLTVIDGLTPEDNGHFIDYRGESMPW
ncbi:MAG: SDR family oxidoreductase [Gammaproteobacteria bacterium]|nr:SDR family oxidoreductase [Gammaproteobacteria bacterium]